MSINKSVLILGSGHLATRTKYLVLAKGYSAKHLPFTHFNKSENDLTTIGEIELSFKDLAMDSFALAYVLYENDEDNLEMVIAMTTLYPNLKIATSLFNENIRPHLERANSLLTIINPAKIAAPIFVESLNQPINRTPRTPIRINNIRSNKKPADSLLKMLVAFFVIIVLGASAYFHFFEQLTLLDSFYFVIVTISSVGYGDINMQHASSFSKVVDILLILFASAFIGIIFSLIVDRIIKKRTQRLLGRKKYNYSNHVIVCGLGRLGHFIADELYKKGEKIVIIEAKEDAASIEYFRSINVDVYIGNARQPNVLQDAGAERCRALISVINNDAANLEIGLNARYFQPDLRLILRIFDESMAAVVKEKFDIHLTQSMSFIAAENFAAMIS